MAQGTGAPEKGLPARPSQLKADDALLDKVLSAPDSKEFADLRDRMAYVYVTGIFPTHLRTLMTGLLSKLTSYSRSPAAMDRRSGSMTVAPEMAERLSLETHPMVIKAREYVAQGYSIQTGRGPKARRPFGKVFIFKRGEAGGTHQLTLQIDGSIKEGWD